MNTCNQHHDIIAYDDASTDCPLCAAILQRDQFYGEVHDLKKQVRELTHQVAVERNAQCRD